MNDQDDHDNDHIDQGDHDDPNDYLDDDEDPDDDDPDDDEGIMKVLGKFGFQVLIPNFPKLSHE